jgi:hypothetical protein
MSGDFAAVIAWENLFHAYRYGDTWGLRRSLLGKPLW